MDTNSKDTEPPETKEFGITAENASLILGNETFVTLENHAAELTPDSRITDHFKSPLDFSTVTVEQLGITPESFIKNTSGKSLSNLKKSRRRSTVGVRGSPETNNLIRFIAQQRNLKNAEKSPLTQDFPFPGSPVLYRNVSSLRERISAFQSAFQTIKEKGKSTDCPEFREAEGEFEKIALNTKENLSEHQQPALPAQSSKRRRIASQSDSKGSLTNAADLQTFSTAIPPHTDRTCTAEVSLADLPEKFLEPGLAPSGYFFEASIPCPELRAASAGIKAADCAEGRGSRDAVSFDKFVEVSTGLLPGVGSLVTPLCQRDIPSSETSVLRSVLKKPSVKLCLESLQEHCDNLYDHRTHPSLVSNPLNCCKEEKAEGPENNKVPAFVNMRKRKRVTFGEDLSPEVFDESLPANTPLRKGGTPVRREDFSRIGLELREQSPVPEQFPQPNFDDKGEDLENVEPLQVSFAVASPLSISSVSETLSGTDTFNSSNNHEKIPSCKDGRRTRTSNRRSQLISFGEESVCSLLNTETQPCTEKKIKRKSQESKRTDRVLPKKNSVLKSSRKKKARRKKGVQKTLYGERDIASKKPLLSPIPELPEVSGTPPPPPGLRRVLSDDFNSNGELEERKPPERKNLFPQNSEECSKHNVSEFCSSYVKSSLLLTKGMFDQDSNTNTGRIHANKIIPKGKLKLKSENDLKTGTENENSHISYASVTKKPVVSDGPQSDFLKQSQDLSTAGRNTENLQSLNISGARTCEQHDDFSVATEGKLQTTHLMSASQKEGGYSEDVLIDSRKGKESQGEDLGRNRTESSSGTSYERKQRRRSVCYLGGQKSHLGKSGTHKGSNSVGSSAEISLENSELYKDLSESIEQTFQRTNRETKVRRSTRLQKDLENEGLIWISLPAASTSCPSQRTRRRTVHTLDSRGFESVSPGGKAVSHQQKLGIPCSVSDGETSGGVAAPSSPLPWGKRRRSLCVSALVHTADMKPKC